MYCAYNYSNYVKMCLIDSDQPLGVTGLTHDYTPMQSDVSSIGMTTKYIHISRIHVRDISINQYSACSAYKYHSLLLPSCALTATATRHPVVVDYRY